MVRAIREKIMGIIKVVNQNVSIVAEKRIEADTMLKGADLVNVNIMFYIVQDRYRKR